MDERISTLVKHNKELKEKLKKIIKERKTFEKLLPILKKIDFENVSYTYRNTDRDYIRLNEDLICNEVLGLCNVRTVVGDPDYTRNFYIIYNKGILPKYDKYRLNMNDFMICITDDIKDIELILRGVIGTRYVG